jgi:hypothetical protein
MLRTIIVSLVLLPAGLANAQSCPEFFRFVDFGLQELSGQFSRGGPLFRAENFAGSPVLVREETQCREVRDLAKDGFGNPIPVVTRIKYAVAQTGIDLTDLHVSFSEDISLASAENAKAHRDRLETAAVDPIRGQSSLCVLHEGPSTISCQVVSPYSGNVDLVIYCNLEHCKMPVLAIDETLSASATWQTGPTFWTEPRRIGKDIYEKIQSIEAFLDPLSSGL